MRFLEIIALALLAGITYGVLHDQVTVRVCIEYFTIGHPRIFSTMSPTLLAIGWGIIATWWFARVSHWRARPGSERGRSAPRASSFGPSSHSFAQWHRWRSFPASRVIC
jgi:hypothetical protein